MACTKYENVNETLKTMIKKGEIYLMFYGGYGYGAGFGTNNGFVLLVVLFILLIIVGASFY